MASKAFKRKNRVKEFKQQNKQTGPKKNYVVPVISVVIALVVIYFIISALTGPKFIPVPNDDPSTGPSDAKVTVIEFGCFTCPYTKKFNTDVFPKLREKYDGKVNFVFKNMPIWHNQGAGLAAQASECANEQGKFWEYSDMLFRGPSAYDRTTLKGFAEALGLDIPKFTECLDSKIYKDEVQDDYNDGKKAGISTTPTLFINGFKVVGVHEFSIYTNIIDDMLSSS